MSDENKLASDIVRETRNAAGLPAADFGQALGYRMPKENLRKQVCDMEHGRKPVTEQVRRLCVMFYRFGVPDDFWKKGKSNV